MKTQWSMKTVSLLLSILFSIALQAQHVIGYVPYWSGTASEIQYDKLTHINYSFAIPDVDGHLKPLQNTAKLQQIVANAHAVGGKVLIAIGGWSENGVVLDSRFEAIGANPQYRTNLVNDIVNLVNQYNLDGADMDWEFPDAGASADNFEALMTELYNALHPMGKLVTSAVSGSSWGGQGINTNVRNVVDWLNIMAYDFNNQNHSTYSDALGAVAYYQQKGFPNSKLALGVPFYARPSWESYASIVGRGADPYQDSFDGNGYNGINTIKQKTNYVINNGLRGVMIWEISQDLNNQYSLVTAIDEEINTNGTQNEHPTVSLTSPTNGSSFIEGNTIQLSASASDNDGSIAKVEFYNGTTKIGEDASAPYSYTLSNAAVGSYSFTAKAIDNLGASATSSAANVTVNIDPTACNFEAWRNRSWYNPGDYVVYNNHAWLCVNRNRSSTPGTNSDWSDQGQCGGGNSNQAPSVSITSPSVNQQIEEGNSISLAANASDADGTISKVEFYLNGSKVGEDLSAPFTLNAGNLSAGNYSVYAVATDNDAASTTSSSINFSVVAPVQNQAPLVSITSPSNNAQFNEGNAISLTANASDSDGSVALVEFYLNGSKVGQDASAPYSYNAGTLSTGNYTVYAVATDNEGATTTAANVNFSVNEVIQNQAPSVSISSPTNNAQIDEGTSVSINAIATDADGTISGVQFYLNGTLVFTDNSSPYIYDAGTLSAGNYTVYAVATDNDNATTTSATVNFDINTVIVGDCNAPAWSSSSIYTGGDEVAHNNKLWRAKWWTSGDEPGTTGEFGVWEDLGNCSGTGTNQLPEGTITAPSNGSVITEGASVVLEASASDVDGSVAQVEFYINGALVSTDNTSPYSYDAGQLAAGNYNVYVIVQDDEGAESASSQSSFTVESEAVNQAPTVAISSPTAGTQIPQGTSVVLEANAGDSDGTISIVEFYVDGVYVGEDAIAPFNFDIGAQSTGDYIVYAVATDNEGASTTSSSVSYSVTSNTGGGCNLTTYVEGTVYNAGDQVENLDEGYTCEVAGWCSGAAWAYAPGTGLYWDMAWSYDGPCASEEGSLKAAVFNGTEQVNVEISSKEVQVLNISVYNALGQLIFNDAITVLNGTVSYLLSSSSWNSGYYVLQIEGQKEAVKQVIVK
jgi:GH18 family chitinase/chitodextrinase